jgi:hypothetical protein
MAATRGQQIQDQCRRQLVRHPVLRRADREAGAKTWGVAAELATPPPAWRNRNSDAQPSRGVLGTCSASEAPHQHP